MPFPFLLTFSQSGTNHDRISFGAGIGLPSISTYSPDGSTFTQWLTQWRYNDRENTIRKFICVTGILLHIPLNLFYIRGWGSLWILWGILSALFNFWFVCIGFWWLDFMRGERWVYGRRTTRQHFDMIIAFLLVVYTFSFILTTITGLNSNGTVYFFNYWWSPLWGMADLLCPLAGWVSTWEGTGVVNLA
ncbi:hypothetical protein BELL_0617g00080 [Botrytis elliptica]|uniref:Uncharacterized protein n=1 Tax=Botrytis elliptica TaxID=278938 RepID=A0A4Z1JP82_9HELO|nr:hypothetical protein EAE99_004638 [Botrytis elliptica]TGO71123.1 hypothetical protein BELL_0617g00080 [Botrytis elliptica]